MRIFWAFNNEWLIKNEVSQFEKQGNSIYITKIPLLSVNAKITYDYDEKLGLPDEVLHKLNNYNFYTQIIEKSIIELINLYFDVVIMDYNKYMLQSFILFFNGKIVLRPLEYSLKENYTEKIKDDIGFWIIKEIEKIKERFFVSLPNGKETNDKDIISKEYILNWPDLPIKLEQYKNNVGVEQEVLFVCSEIKSDERAYKQYKMFEKEFKNFNYTIIGKQYIKVTNNRSVISLSNTESYQEYFKKYTVLFYYSKDEKEIPYYLFEAFQIGIPVIFLVGGYLDAFETKNFMGRCEKIESAKKLCKKIISGNERLIDKIKQQQYEFLNSLNNDILSRWENLLDTLKTPHKVDGKIIKKIKLAVVIPGEYTGGVLDYSIRLIRAIKKGAELDGQNLEIILGHLNHPNYEKKDYFEELKKLNVSIRKYDWEIINKERIEEIFLLQGYNFENIEEEYIVLNDGITYFEDCDCILFTADRVQKNFYSTKPYGVILHDYIQRYVPEVIGDRFEKSFLDLARRSASNFTTTQVVKSESIQYGGIEGCRTHLIPLFFGEIENKYINNKEIINEEEYFVWSTNTNVHKNHKFALNALAKYYEGGGKIKCKMIGADTEKLDLKIKFSGDTYIEDIREILQQNKKLTQNIEILGNMPKSAYMCVLSNAKFLFHPGYADNGNGTAFDAAMLGVPTLSCDYPAMRNMNEKTNMNMQFFENNDVNNLLQLLKSQENITIKHNLPSRKELELFTVSNDELCKKIYSVIKEYLPI